MGSLLHENRLRQKLGEGKTVYGPFMKLSDPSVAEIFGYAGFDFVIIDLEHGPLSIETAQHIVRAAQLSELTPIVRVTGNDPAKIVRALDIGAQGVQVPQICTQADAEKAIEAARFAPKGNRGVCRFVRAASYSAIDRYSYFKQSNKNTTIILMVEGLEGVNNLDAILSVPGIDIIFIGPYDLSQSLGITGQVNHPSVVEKMKEVVFKARQNEIVVGTFVDNIETAHKWRELGIRYISYSVDVGIVYDACKSISISLRETR